jgi:hypothetical protein
VWLLNVIPMYRWEITLTAKVREELQKNNIWASDRSKRKMRKTKKESD